MGIRRAGVLSAGCLQMCVRNLPRPAQEEPTIMALEYTLPVNGSSKCASLRQASPARDQIRRQRPRSISRAGIAVVRCSGSTAMANSFAAPETLLHLMQPSISDTTGAGPPGHCLLHQFWSLHPSLPSGPTSLQATASQSNLGAWHLFTCADGLWQPP